ncbi:MAG: ribosome silencing factor [Chloroflexi bacterium GWB2_49_20]|nr:MAG: ribosome silencing factor [Chloroflexi bacterium GWB2_49_20]OGN78130.1 MAG: ribosome silencing factor [Chloroflexi bacterium GWC2_49_37]OGN85166.1 MAG: ribosome silencing factor [Chloroflexi bacterium GWD2_49_16]
MLDIAHTIVNSLEEKKGEEILLLDIQKIASFTDYFIICTGTSDRMLDALADSVVMSVNEKHKIKGKIEGNSQCGWMVVDFGSILVHLFSPDQRDYYKLEDLWHDGRIILHVQ